MNFDEYFDEFDEFLMNLILFDEFSQSLLSGGYDQMGLSESWNQLITADFSDNHITVIDDSVVSGLVLIR